MDYKKTLERLEALKKVLNSNNSDEIAIHYGAVEEVILRFGGVTEIKISGSHGSVSTYKNYIEAGFLSGWTMYSFQGRNQLLSIIGKIRALSEDPEIPTNEFSITQVIKVLKCFREACQYLRTPLSNEKEVQDILWIMLRPQYERLERENTLPRFASKNYKPDFGIVDLNTLIEVKFIGEKTEVAKIQEEILADIPGYLNEATKFNNLIVFIYDSAHKLKDSRKFIEDIKGVDGISECIVIPGI